MPTKKRTQARKAPAKPKTNDALSLLKADHREVEALFDQYEKLKERNGGRKAEIAHKICTMLTAHATIEEEIFYPALRDAIDEVELLDEAEVEHMTAKQLIADIEEMDPEEDLFDAKVKVLGEYIKHHVKEEEGEIFKAAKKSDLDLEMLGEELKERKQELLSELGEDISRPKPKEQPGIFRM